MIAKPHQEPSVLPTLSIVIPTLDEAHSIARMLDAVARLEGCVEVIVVDGGSRDQTVDVARERGARVIMSARGRGVQLHAGASMARGAAIWFLHADTLPPADAARQITEAVNDTKVIGGNCYVRFDGESRAARFLTWLYPKLRRIGLCYGDSAIFVRREHYEEVGGFQPFPIFEDLDLVRRLRRKGRMVHLPITVTTSSRRFENCNFALVFARWATMQALYWLGMHPCTLARLYHPVRDAQSRRKA